MYEVILENPPQRFIKNLIKEEQISVFEAVQLLEVNPFVGKSLLGKLAGFRSMRLDTKRSSYRIIYKIENIQLQVIVLRVGYRDNVYHRNAGK